MMRGTNPTQEAARHLLSARHQRSTTSALPVHCRPSNCMEAYAIQDAVAPVLGATGGWKIGASSPNGMPRCAPLATTGILNGPTILTASDFPMRGIEVEVAFLLAADLPARGHAYTRREVCNAIGAVLPVIEVVESRYHTDADIDMLSKLADNISHGALILGPQQTKWSTFDWTRIQAQLTVDNNPCAQTVNGNPAGDLFYLLEWLANHLPTRGQSLKAGQIVTTGSCTGLVFVAADSHVQGVIDGLGAVDLRFQ